MLRYLADQKSCTITELVQPFEMSFAAASKHVKVLEKANLIHRKVDGRKHLCTFTPSPLIEAENWMSFYKQFWSLRLDALEDLLKDGDMDE